MERQNHSLPARKTFQILSSAVAVVCASVCSVFAVLGNVSRSSFRFTGSLTLTHSQGAVPGRADLRHLPCSSTKTNNESQEK
eukprot:scaffold504_cov189-Ochromonas_danica.AAC.38